MPSRYFWLMVGLNIENLAYWLTMGFIGNLEGFRPEVALAIFLPVFGMIMTANDNTR